VDDLAGARAERWWQTRRHLGRIDRAGRFIDDVGFALLFPKVGIELPSLWEAASDRPLTDAFDKWEADIDRVWQWKDELPRRGFAWYGSFVRGRKSFLAPRLLADLYPREGRPDDFDEAQLSPDARRIARILLLDGPQSTAVLREALDVAGSGGKERFARALDELGRGLVTTGFGVRDEGTGWPSAVLELAARVFTIPGGRDAEKSRLGAARAFLDTTLVAMPNHLGNAFHWRADAARAAFEELVARGEAERISKGYALSSWLASWQGR
jgi:hypothetical protein